MYVGEAWPALHSLDLLMLPLQVLHDAFFKNQTKPPLSQMGQLYYEGKEYEAHVSVDAVD